MQVTEELFDIMEMFTDSEVYDITDYLKSEEEYFSDESEEI